MLTAVLFTIAKKVEEARWPLNDEQTDEMRYIHTLAYYSAIKMNGLQLVWLSGLNAGLWTKRLLVRSPVRTHV